MLFSDEIPGVHRRFILERAQKTEIRHTVRFDMIVLTEFEAHAFFVGPEKREHLVIAFKGWLAHHHTRLDIWMFGNKLIE